MIYVFSLFLLLLCAVFDYTVKVRQGKNNNEKVIMQQRSCRQRYVRTLLFYTLFLIVLVGMRHYTVGWDTGVYYTFYYSLRNISSFSELISYCQSGMTTMEVGYIVLTWIFSRFTSFYVYNTICSATFIIPVFLVIKRYSINPWLSMFIFVTYGMYVFAFSGTRQIMAMGICCLALLAACENRLKKFILLWLLAILFHRTALIFFPVYFMIHIKAKRSIVAMLYVAAVACYPMRGMLLAWFETYRRSTLTQYRETGGMLLYLFVLFFVVIATIMRKKNMFALQQGSKERINTFCFYSMFAVLVLIPILRVTPTYFRLYYYYYIFIMIFIPNLLQKISTRVIRISLLCVVLIIGVYLYYKQIVLTTNPLLPYMFGWE